MNWQDDPATEHQLTLLRNLGFAPDRPLGLTEAARLIRQYQKRPPRPGGYTLSPTDRANSPGRTAMEADRPLASSSVSNPGLLNKGIGSGFVRASGATRLAVPSRSPDLRAARAAPGPVRMVDISESTRMQAYHLRLATENAKRAMAERPNAPNIRADLASAVNGRQEFWLETCRDVKEMRIGSVQIFELYQAYGCRFSAPIASQVQIILDALDPAMPLWDRDHPGLFYQTLELNFPHLLRLR